MTSITLRGSDRLLREDDEQPEMAGIVGNMMAETFSATVTVEVNSITLADIASCIRRRFTNLYLS